MRDNYASRLMVSYSSDSAGVYTVETKVYFDFFPVQYVFPTLEKQVPDSEHQPRYGTGIDLKNPKTYDAVFAQQERYLNDLQCLYEQVPVTRATS